MMANSTNPGKYTVTEEDIVNLAIQDESKVFLNDKLVIQKPTLEQVISSPLQKRRLEEVIPIIERILSEITLKKINEKRMSS